MTELNETVYNVSSIYNRMKDSTLPKSKLHMFAGGAYKQLTKEQVRDLENIIDRDYSVAKNVIKQARVKLSSK